MEKVLQQKSSYFSALMLGGSFLYSGMGFVRFISLLLGREKAMINLHVPTVKIQEQVGLFSSDLIFGAYYNYSYIGIYIAVFALLTAGVYMLCKKELQKIMLVLLVVNLLLAIYLHFHFGW